MIKIEEQPNNSIIDDIINKIKILLNRPPLLKRIKRDLEVLLANGLIFYLDEENSKNGKISLLVILNDRDDKCITVKISSEYPFLGPEINFDFDPDSKNLTDRILQQYYTTHLFPSIFLYDALQKVSTKCDFTMPSYSLTDGVNLLIGSHPNENRYNRTYYDNENVYLLDNNSEFEPTERFIRLDFTDLKVLEQFAQFNEGKFTTVSFDWSVWKFFINGKDIPDTINRLNCLHKILKTDGVLIIPNACEPSCIVYPHGLSPLNCTKEQKQKIYDDVSIVHKKLLCDVLMGSNFKFKLMRYDNIDNELLKVGPLSHPSYHEHFTHFLSSNTINCVVVCMK